MSLLCHMCANVCKGSDEVGEDCSFRILVALTTALAETVTTASVESVFSQRYSLNESVVDVLQ